MTTPVVVRKRAKRHILDATSWYTNISRNLGEDFVAAVDDAIESARNYPLAYPVIYRLLRRVLLRRFPYALFYRFKDNRVVIIAVLHQARDPRLLRGSDVV